MKLKQNITRILGVIILIIAAITYKQVHYTLWLAILGLILLISDTKKAGKELKTFTKTYTLFCFGSQYSSYLSERSLTQSKTDILGLGHL